MKRHIHPLDNKNITLYEAIYDINNLKMAHLNAKKGKGWYKEVKEVESDLSTYLYTLQDMLKNKTYRTSPYETFYKEDRQKRRLIYKLPYYPDRICQWAILQVIEPILLRNLIANTYSAIPNRGIHKCLNDVQTAIKRDPSGCAYCLKMDIKQFYPSINHRILKSKYRRIFKDKNLLWLLYEIIDSTEDEIGIPIGNYLSQYSANFYLSSFDHWIKEEKYVAHYFRYMDDIVILHESKEYLHLLKNDIEVYLQNIGLSIKNKWQIFPSYIRGIDFIGYRIFKDFTLLRKRTCKVFKKKMLAISKKIDNGEDLNYSEWCAINSYKGWLKHCNSYRLFNKYISPIEPFADDFYLTNVKGEVIND